MALNTSQSQDVKSGPAWIRCWGESESGPAKLLRLRRLIEASTSSGRKGVSRMLSCSARVASSTFGMVSEIF